MDAQDDIATRPIKIAVVDDHAVVREALVSLADAAPDMRVVGQAASGAEARSMLDHDPDVVLMDYRLGDCTGAEVARALLAEQPDLRIIILTADDGLDVVMDALRAGCVGVVSKEAGTEAFLAAVRKAARGGLAYDSVPKRQTAGQQTLTRREEQVLELLMEGCSTTTIADRLQLSSHTARNYIRTVVTKLGAHSRAEAVAAAYRTRRPPTGP